MATGRPRPLWGRQLLMASSSSGGLRPFVLFCLLPSKPLACCPLLGGGCATLALLCAMLPLPRVRVCAASPAGGTSQHHWWGGCQPISLFVTGHCPHPGLLARGWVTANDGGKAAALRLLWQLAGKVPGRGPGAPGPLAPDPTLPPPLEGTGEPRRRLGLLLCVAVCACVAVRACVGGWAACSLAHACCLMHSL